MSLILFENELLNTVPISFTSALVLDELIMVALEK